MLTIFFDSGTPAAKRRGDHAVARPISIYSEQWQIFPCMAQITGEALRAVFVLVLDMHSCLESVEGCLTSAAQQPAEQGTLMTRHRLHTYALVRYAALHWLK
jgi:hypothetical protein